MTTNESTVVGPAPGESLDASRATGPRVLVVDDEWFVRETLCQLLRDEDMEVVGEAGDGRQAIEMVREHRPDVVLMDLRMPNMGGVEATSHIKREWPDTQVLFLSAYDDEGLDQSALEAGAFCYLIKGCPADLLVSMVEQAWQHGHGD
jgi:DNA-binding NarL/FixJ family response regulator